MNLDDKLIETAAEAAYNEMLVGYGASPKHEHSWANQPEWLRKDWRRTIRRALQVLLIENERLRRQVAGHCERIAAQSEILARRAEKPK